MNDETEELREHLGDDEWMYRHGYYDGTFYAAQRQFIEALQRLASTCRAEMRRSWIACIILAPFWLWWQVFKWISGIGHS